MKAEPRGGRIRTGFGPENITRLRRFAAGICERGTQSAAYLSGGEQQMLAIGRALMASPKFLTLDEPSLGLGPRVFDDILAIIQDLNRAGMSIVIAEQNARKVFRISHYCYVIENGAIALEGSSSELARDERVRGVYLGSRAKDL